MVIIEINKELLNDLENKVINVEKSESSETKTCYCTPEQAELFEIMTPDLILNLISIVRDLGSVERDITRELEKYKFVCSWLAKRCELISDELEYTPLYLEENKEGWLNAAIADWQKKANK